MFKYIIFAVIATIANVGAQYGVLAVISGTYSLIGAMLFGTIVGLALKYILDKKFIFYHQTYSQKENARKFTLYTLMGGITTLIFWGTELSFDYFWDHEYAKYIGAIIGLSIGYVIKYNLDKRFVFVTKGAKE